MRNLSLFSFFIFFIIVFNNFCNSQTVSPVIIKDHNETKNSINIDCNYKFENKAHGIKFTVEYPEINKPLDYTVSSINYTPYGNFSEGKEIIIDKDDKWSDEIKLPFDFCFYGNTFKSIVVGDNGVISFNAAEYASTECPYTIAGPIPNVSLMRNTIFGAYHDMTNDSKAFGCANIGNCGKITMATYGSKPFRTVVINYFNMNHFNCDNKKSTLQVVLYETTNIIDVFIKDKPLTCAAGNEKQALIGLTNGSEKNPIGIFPPNRNKGIWETQNEAWRFTPKGKIKTSIEWYDDNNNLIGTGESVIVYPSSNTSYKAKILYNTCSETYLTGTIQVIFDKEFPTAKKIDKNKCFDGNFPNKVDFNSLALESIGSQKNVTYSFHNSVDDAINYQNSINGIDNYSMMADSKTFYLRVEKTKTCFTVVPLTIKLFKTPKLRDKQEIQFCSNKKNNPLTLYTKDLCESIENYADWMNVEYYYSYEDAQKQISPINSLEIHLPDKKKLYLRIYNKNFEECSQIITAQFSFPTSIELPTMNIITCGNVKGEYKDLTVYEKLVTDYKKYHFTYHKSNQDALKGINPIDNPKHYPVNTYDVYYVRINNYDNKYCPPIGEIIITEAETSVKPLIKYICDNNDKGKTNVNLNDFFKEMVGSSNISLIGFYYDKNATIPVSNPNVFEISQNFSDVYVKFHEFKFNCDFTQSIKIYFYTKVKKISSFEICDMGHDGKEKFSLQNLDKIMLDGYPSETKVTYYNSPTLDSSITDILLTQDTDVYIKVELKNNCFFTYKIRLLLVNHSFAETKDYTVKLCDNNSDNSEIVNLTEYNNFLISNTTGYNFSYFESYDDAHDNLKPIINFTNYAVNFPKTIYVRINDDSSCFNISKLNFQDINTIEAVDYISNLCNYEKRPPINLMDYAKNEMLKSNISDININFYYSKDGAIKELNSDLIPVSQINNYPINSTQSYVWVRFNNTINNCYTIRSIEINIIPLPKLVDSKYLVCDDNFDGIFSIWLEKLKNKVVADTNEYTFSYFHSQKNADDNINPIPYPDKKEFIITSFPKDIYVKASNKFNCSSVKKVTLYTLNKIPIDKTPEIINCDEDFDGITTFDLTSVSDQISLVKDVYYEYYHNQSDAQNQINKISNPENYKNINPVNEVVYVRISSRTSSYCPSIGSIKLTVLPVPKSSLKSGYKICPDGETIIIDANTGNVDDFYEWSNGEKGTNLHKITINASGHYWVTITGTNGCKYTYKTFVSEYEKVKIKQVIAGKDYIKIIAEGPKPLEYSMDNITWQKSNTFSNLEPSTYSIYVRSKTSLCKPTTAKGIIFKINNLITPNGDSHNDNWTLCGLDLFDGIPSRLQIFDRYGKLVFEESSTTCFSWNGYYLGRILPTNSYWYIINIADGRKFTGWILLKNYDHL